VTSKQADNNLAVEKTSPVAWWSVLITNLGVFLGVLLAGVNGLALYWAFSTGATFLYVLVPLVGVGFSFRIFLTAFTSGSLIRKLRYTGTLEVRKASNWVVNVPVWSFGSLKKAEAMTKLFTEELAKTPVEETDERVLVFVVGEKANDEASGYQVKLVHKCNDDGACEKPHMHLFGYNENRDGVIIWPAV
jgi:hypothetical protein